MSKITKIFWSVVTIVIGAGILYWLLAPKPTNGPTTTVEPQGTLKIGAVLPLTGDGAAYGLPIQRAASLAVNEINLAGGVKGQSMEIIWEDGKCDAKEATSAARKLVTVDGVKVILGGVCSSETLSMA